MTNYALDDLLDYLDRTTGQKVKALRWDGTPRQLEALAALGIVEPPAAGDYLVVMPPEIAPFGDEEFSARFEFVGMGETQHGA